ncbi:MAG: hypothetical protein ABI763_02945 [Bacteroidota bacterium]
MKKLHDLFHAHSVLKKETAAERIRISKRVSGSHHFLTDQLESAVSHGYIQNYDEMAVLMYPQTSSQINTLYQVTHRAKRKVLDELTLEDLGHNLRNEYDKRKYEVNRNVMIAEVMILKGFSKPGWELMKKAFVTSVKYELTFFSYQINQRLCYHSSMVGSYSKNLNALRQSLTLSKRLNAEREADNLFSELTLLMRNRWHFEDRIKSKAILAYRRVQGLMRTYHSHALWLAYFRISIYYYYTCGNYRSLLSSTRRFRRYLIERPHLQQDARWAELAHHEINACMTLRNFVYGLRSAEEKKKYLHPNNHNWMLYQENYFQLLLHAKKYGKAREVYNEVAASRFWKNRSTSQREIWKIYLAYLHFALNDTKQIELFMPARFLNEINTFRKDKEGLNFVIQVAEMMYLLAHNDADRLAEFGESFRIYVSRHISRRKHYRSYYFSKLLLLLFKYDFDVGKAEIIGEKFHNRLLSFQTRSQQDREMSELIPYDHLWIMILRVMKEKK